MPDQSTSSGVAPGRLALPAARVGASRMGVSHLGPVTTRSHVHDVRGRALRSHPDERGVHDAASAADGKLAHRRAALASSRAEREAAFEVSGVDGSRGELNMQIKTWTDASQRISQRSPSSSGVASAVPVLSWWILLHSLPT